MSGKGDSCCVGPAPTLPSLGLAGQGRGELSSLSRTGLSWFHPSLVSLLPGSCPPLPGLYWARQCPLSPLPSPDSTPAGPCRAVPSRWIMVIPCGWSRAAFDWHGWERPGEGGRATLPHSFTMGTCYSLRSRLLGPHAASSIAYPGPRTASAGGGDGEAGHNEQADGQLRERLRADEKARLKADKKRSRSIDKSLKAEKREYKQTHRLLLLGEPSLIYFPVHLSPPPPPGHFCPQHQRDPFLFTQFPSRVVVIKPVTCTPTSYGATVRKVVMNLINWYSHSRLVGGNSQPATR